jgi:hypothetical protein
LGCFRGNFGCQLCPFFDCGWRVSDRNQGLRGVQLAAFQPGSGAAQIQGGFVLWAVVVEPCQKETRCRESPHARARTPAIQPAGRPALQFHLLWVGFAVWGTNLKNFRWVGYPTRNHPGDEDLSTSPQRRRPVAGDPVSLGAPCRRGHRRRSDSGAAWMWHRAGASLATPTHRAIRLRDEWGTRR